jgi:fructuronate reductase
MTHELMPVLDVPEGFDLAQYRDQLLARFANPCLHHRCAQIAMHGTEKIPQRWLQTLHQCTSAKDMAPIGPFSKRDFSAGYFFSLAC